VNPPPPPAATSADIVMNVTSSANPSVFGEPVTFTANIVAPQPFHNVPVLGKVRPGARE